MHVSGLRSDLFDVHCRECPLARNLSGTFLRRPHAYCTRSFLSASRIVKIRDFLFCEMQLL
jgi:hypothetical protein